MTSPPSILGSFVDQLAARDFEGLASCLDPEVRLRAIIPPRLEENHDRGAAAGRFGDWFADAERFELVERRIEPFVDRWLVRGLDAVVGRGAPSIRPRADMAYPS